MHSFLDSKTLVGLKTLTFKFFKYLLVTVTFLQSSIALSDFDNPLRDPQQLNKPTDSEFVQTAYPLKRDRVKVAIANYEAIRRDFLETRTMTEHQINDWLIEKAAYMGENQVNHGAANHTNTEIPVDRDHPKQVYRPKDYGRAHVVPVGENGLIDVKGAGAMNPTPGGHSNGVATLAEGLREYSFEKLAQKIFDHEGSGDHTVGTYAILDPGFDVNLGTADHPAYEPAGLILRQAHVRSKVQHAHIPLKEALRVEKLFRKYGLLTTVHFEKKGGSALNIQGTKDGAVIDFGSYFVSDRFTDTIVHCNQTIAGENKKSLGDELYRQIEKNEKGYPVLLEPSHPDYIHSPEPNDQIPLYFWGPEYHWKPGVGNWREDGEWDPHAPNWAPAGDKATTATSMYARDFRNGRLSQAEVTNWVNYPLNMVDFHWNSCRPEHHFTPEQTILDRIERPLPPESDPKSSNRTETKHHQHEDTAPVESHENGAKTSKDAH